MALLVAATAQPQNVQRLRVVVVVGFDMPADPAAVTDHLANQTPRSHRVTDLSVGFVLKVEVEPGRERREQAG